MKLSLESGLKLIHIISLQKQSWPLLLAVNKQCCLSSVVDAKNRNIHILFSAFQHIKLLGTRQTAVIWFFGTAAEMVKSEGKWALCYGYTGLFIDVGSVVFVYQWLIAKSRTVKIIGYIISNLE